MIPLRVRKKKRDSSGPTLQQSSSEMPRPNARLKKNVQPKSFDVSSAAKLAFDDGCVSTLGGWTEPRHTASEIWDTNVGTMFKGSFLAFQSIHFGYPCCIAFWRVLMISLGFSETVFFCRAETKTTLVQKKGAKKSWNSISRFLFKRRNHFFQTRMTHDPFRLPDISFHAKLFPFQDLNYKP